MAQVQGEDIPLIMHCWHYLRRSWYKFTVVFYSGGIGSGGDHGCWSGW